MFYFLVSVNIIALILMLFMLAVCLHKKLSKSQLAFIIYDIFTMLFVVGVHLELVHSDTVGEALAGLCIQYVGQAGFLMAFLWFASEFGRLKIPKFVYFIQAVINTIVLTGVFTAEYHPYFYKTMRILKDGIYHRIEVIPGIIWKLHYIHLGTVILAVLILCIMRYGESSPIHKKRIIYMIAGVGTFALELILKGLGVFGSYNPVVIAMTIMMFCMMMAMIRYGYFGSLQAAVDNAFNHGKEGLIILDAENKIISVNQRMKELFPEIKVGSAASRQKEILQALTNRERLLHKNDRIYELRMEDIVENGEKDGCMLWFIDQTENLEMMQRLRSADEAKTRFLMKVSHELRTPMHTILGMNEVISEETSEEKIRRYTREIASAGDSMIALIEEVLDASRLESGTLQIKKDAFALEEVINDAAAQMRPQAEKKSLSFRLRMEEPLLKPGKHFYGDKAHIRQIIINLLENALKYTDEGFVELGVEKAVENGDTFLKITVTDSGIGIGKEEQDKIFEIFERGNNARNSRKDGIGLGLDIARQLAEAMGGSLSLISEVTKGSTFTVRIPWVEVSEKHHFTKQSAKSMNADYSSFTILAVDDNEQNLMVLEHLLHKTRVKMETVMDGNTAVQKCEEKTYDLLLLDHMMPKPDGIETLHLIRADEKGRNHYTQAVAFTANATAGAKELYKNEGFAEYITKPVKPGTLEIMLQKYLRDYLPEENMVFQGSMDDTKVTKLRGLLHYLEKHGIAAEEGLSYADGDEQFYKELLGIFVKEKEKKQHHLEKAFQSLKINHVVTMKETETDTEMMNELWKTFVIQSHGLKGEAWGIGARTLGDFFYQLECAGKERSLKKIEHFYPEAMEEWQQVVDAVQRVL